MIQIELKDKKNLAAKKALVKLIQKHERQRTTIIGCEREIDCRELHELDPSIPKFTSMEASLKYLLYYYLGILPFARIYQDAFSVPYMTRDYMRMKLMEAREKNKWYYAFIMVTVLSNKTMNPMIEHLNKRGMLTDYWVINDDDEIRHVIKNTKVLGVMSDRPTRVQHILQEEQSMV